MQAAIGNKIPVILTLLISPQGGPKYCDGSINKLQKKWITFLCCMNRLENEQIAIKLPKEITTIIFAYCLPKPKVFINHVPLMQIPKYKAFMCPAYKDQIIIELVRRHVNQHRHVLSTKVHYKKTCFTPKQMAANRGYELAATILDHKAHECLKHKIKMRYMSLFE